MQNNFYFANLLFYIIAIHLYKINLLFSDFISISIEIFADIIYF